MLDRIAITKSERALLRRLAEEAWNTELREALTRLFENFGKWSDGGMSAFELSDKIHEFHNGISRELNNRYTTLRPEALVCQAISLGIVEESALSKPLLEKLAISIESFRELRGEE